jgi:hypothetical protein
MRGDAGAEALDQPAQRAPLADDVAPAVQPALDLVEGPLEDDIDAPAAGRALVLHEVELAGLRHPGGAEAGGVPVVAEPPQPDVVFTGDVPALVGGIEGAEG